VTDRIASGLWDSLVRRYSPGRRHPPRPKERAARRRRSRGEGSSPEGEDLNFAWTLLKSSRVKGALRDFL